VYSTARLYNQVVMDMQQTDPLSATFAALADPTRRAILARLAKGEATVTELGKPFDMSQPAISKHIKVLERARGAVAAVSPRGAPARTGDRMDESLPRPLGGELRPPRQRAGRDEGGE